MAVSPFFAILRNQNPRAFLQISGDWKALLRMHFLHAALDSGLLPALAIPRTKKELVAELEVRRPELLDAILELGISLGELSRREGRYRVRGSRSRALQEERNDALAGMVQANVTYYGDAFRDFARRLRGGPRDGRIQSIGPLVARVSRIAEPFVEHFLRETVRDRRPLRILDVGCGSGLHFRIAVKENPEVTGLGLDVDQEVVLQARENLRRWGLEDRVEIVQGDIQSPPEEARGPFDLILLFNVIYYFPEAERVTLLRSLRGRLSPGGTVVITTSCRGEGADLFSANLNLATASMEGLTPLPETEEMEAHLQRAGFSAIRRKRLVARTTYYGFVSS
jgi:SAM-dependent methyltransferase